MSMMRYPDELHTSTAAEAVVCRRCDTDRGEGRWYICDYHEGWDDALEAAEQVKP